MREYAGAFHALVSCLDTTLCYAAFPPHFDLLPVGLPITSVSEADRWCEDQIWHGLGMLQNKFSVLH